MKYQHIIFDFDGALAESNEIRFNGFRKLFKDYPQEQVEQLVEYAKANGGVSRYKKIEFFFNTIRKEPVSSKSVNHWANQFSELVTIVKQYFPQTLIVQTVIATHLYLQNRF